MSLRVAPQRHEAVSHETVDSYRWISCLGGDCFGLGFDVYVSTISPRNDILSLIKRLLDDIFDRWIGNGDVVDGQISQKSRSDAGDIFRFYLDVLLLPVFLILNGSPILGQVM